MRTATLFAVTPVGQASPVAAWPDYDQALRWARRTYGLDGATVAPTTFRFEPPPRSTWAGR